MAASTAFVRGYLRKAWADAQAEAVTLLAKLTALNSEAIAATATGQVIQSTSGNGRSITFSDAGETTPNDIVEMLDRLLSLYDAAVADSQTTDPLRFAWMLEHLQPVRSVRSHFGAMIHR